jgi:hypothetical protein
MERGILVQRSMNPHFIIVGAKLAKGPAQMSALIEGTGPGDLRMDFEFSNGLGGEFFRQLWFPPGQCETRSPRASSTRRQPTIAGSTKSSASEFQSASYRRRRTALNSLICRI